jgi:hypothetical protein
MSGRGIKIIPGDGIEKATTEQAETCGLLPFGQHSQAQVIGYSPDMNDVNVQLVSREKFSLILHVLT